MASSSGSGEAETREACYSDQRVSLLRRDCNGLINQSFVYDDAAGTFKFAKDTNYCFELNGGNTANGTSIVLW
jgi:hypothetical protein